MKRLNTLALLVGSALPLLAGCDGNIRQPFSGPQYSMSDGLLGDFDDDHVFVIAATSLPVRDGARELFDGLLKPIVDDLDGHEGLIGYSFAQQLVGEDVNRTLTVWDSYESMYAFVASDAHVAAMAESGEIEVPGAARTVVWEGTKADLPPTWDDAELRLEQDGKNIGY